MFLKSKSVKSMNYWRLQKTALHPCPVCLKNISKLMSAIWWPSSELSGCVRPRNHRWQLKWSARFFCTSVTAVDSAAHILNWWRTNGAGSFDLGPFLGPRLLSHRAVCGDRGLASAGWHAAEPRDPIARGSASLEIPAPCAAVWNSCFLTYV